MNTGSEDRKTEALRQNEAKIASLYEEYYGKIARYAYAHIGNRTEAEDIAGEVFLKALESLRSYRERGIPMQAWLFRIAHNLVVDHLRKTAKHKTVPIDTVPVEADTDPAKVAEINIELAR
jgi:RNA polymerase sigma-70 factor (ECF subfamily)